ncbi:MAG: tRNA (N6-threonylcarbamoyladenosine(37)-N6)-methyltransferase TrmO [Acidobacteriaceae bacterium]
MQVKPIGVIHTPFHEVKGTPIQSRAGEGVEGWVEVFPEFVAGLKDLSGFERIWLVYRFDRTAAREINLHVTPCLDTKSHGVFASRAAARPNLIGMSAVCLLGVRRNRLKIRGIDILDGTPLLDIKPYIAQFDCFQVARNGWLGETNGAALADGRLERDEAGKGETCRKEAAGRKRVSLGEMGEITRLSASALKGA